jgi:hypothetical protein
LALFLCLFLLGFLAVRNIHSFLAVTKPLPAGILVIEGWAPDSAMQLAIGEFRRHHYDKVYVTGGPVQLGSFLTPYNNFADLGAADMLKFGLTTNEVQAVPAPYVGQDRTYTSAVCLAKWLRQHQVAVSSVHLMTQGVHARRSWLLYRKAFGKGVTVGVTALPDDDYDPVHWWRTSAGVRSVIGESLAYGYARFLFRAAKEN